MVATDGTDSDISVLTVTADSAFAAACERHLPDKGAIQVTTVTSVGEAVDILATDGVDCIVSDHDLPDTDGIAFLELVRAQAPTLPFILFTSEGSEDLASRAISADVTEYLIKEHHSDQWDRLARLVEDVVNYHQTHGSLVDTESRAKALLDAAHDIITVVSDGRIEYINQTGVDLIGVDTRAAVTEQPVENILTLASGESITDRITAVQRGNRSLERIEAQLVPENGRPFPIEVTATPITWLETPAAALVVRDISERKAYESDLKLKNRAMDEAPLGVTIADATQPDNPLIYVNDQFEELTGYARTDVLGRNCRFLQGERTASEPVTAMGEAIDAEIPVTVELRNYRTDGTEFWNRVTIAPIEDGGGEVTHYVGFQEDVTERKEDERMLRRFEEAIEAAGHAVYMTDVDGTIEYVNPAFERVTGYSREEAIGRNPRILNSGEMSDDYYERLWETLLSGEYWEEEIVNRHKRGELYHAHQTIAPVTKNGTVTGFVAIQTDITEQKEREAKLRQYERAIDGANELIAALDTDYRYLFANPAYRAFHNIETEDVSGMTLTETLGTDLFERIKPHIDRALAGDTVEYRMTRVQPDKPNRTFDIRYYPLEDETGERQGVVATFKDRTEQVERETQLAALDRMLRHTLRNDLNIILSRAELIANRESGETESDARVIERTTNQLFEQAEKEREIVELLTDPSQATVQNLSKIVTDVVTRVETRNPAVETTVDMPDDLQLRTIPEIERAIRELLENAVVHSDRDQPKVSVSVTEHDESIEFRFVDDGPKIPLEEQRVRAEEEKVDQLLHSQGMGLWLVKRIVTLVGGTLEFDEADPRGNVVTITVPKD